MTYKEIVKKAKSLGLKGSGKKDELLAAIAAVEAEAAKVTLSHEDAVAAFLEHPLAQALGYSAFDNGLFKRDASNCSRCAGTHKSDLVFERKDGSLRSSCLRCATRRSSIRQMLENFAAQTRRESMAQYRAFVNEDTPLGAFIREMHGIEESVSEEQAS